MTKISNRAAGRIRNMDDASALRECRGLLRLPGVAAKFHTAEALKAHVASLADTTAAAASIPGSENAGRGVQPSPSLASQNSGAQTEWDASEEVRAEFLGNFEAFKAFRMAFADGRVKIAGEVVVRADSAN